MAEESNYAVNQRAGIQSDPIREHLGDEIANAYNANLAKIPKEQLTLTLALSALHDAYSTVRSDFVHGGGPTCGCFDHCRVEGDFLPDRS